MAEESSSVLTAKTILSTVASVAATGMVVRSVIRDYISDEVQHSLFLRLWKFFSRAGNDVTMVIDEFDGLVSNEIYSAAECYLGPKISPATRRFRISKTEKEKDIKMSMEKGQVVLDVYDGKKLKWVCVVKNTEPKTRHFSNPRDIHSTWRSEVRSFELSFHKKNMDMVISSYLPRIIQESQLKKCHKKTVKIHTVDSDEFFEPGDVWKSVNLDHPATFDTIAMDADKKDMILKDLEMFVKGRGYYRRVGKAWKRGYLLYGPPGTGKSSLIAAMANFLNFDIYDLELSSIRRNSDLKKLLMATANKSILVVEDIDCTIDLGNRMNKKTVAAMDFHQNKVTLSGFLNFIDGLWSSCGDERIIIFTTNHIENLDPALLRPGRMDVHIHMSYCTPSGFRRLANSYLALEDHPLFKDIEELIRTTKVTPAEVAEQLLKQNQNKPEASLEGLMEFLQESKRKQTDKEALKQPVDDEKVETDTEPAIEEIKRVHAEKKNETGSDEEQEDESEMTNFDSKL